MPRYIRRKVLWLIVSDERTRRGKPTSYDFYLECGHTRSEYHNPTAVGTAAMWSGGAEATLGCRNCTAGKELTYYDRLRLGKLPIRALDQHPALKAAWDKVKGIEPPEYVKKALREAQ